MEHIVKGFLLLIILLAMMNSQGCATSVEPDSSAISSVDPEIQVYFSRFESIIGVGTAGINGEKVSLPFSSLAMCVIDTVGNRTVQVAIYYWKAATDSQKEETIFHELGHCAMGLQHIYDLRPDHCPVSIMYPYEFGDTLCYENNKEYYYQELQSHK